MYPASVKSIFGFKYIAFICNIIFIIELSLEEDIPGLYKSTDPLVELRNDTIMKSLVGSKKVWIIEFYSSWCGHCQAFAPKWVRLAKQLQNWNRYIEVGALNCANERNRDTCNTFNIEMYPTIKYFDFDWQNITANVDEDGYQQMGFTYKGSKSIVDLRHKLIDVIENQTNPNYDKSRIPFHPLKVADLSTYMKERKNDGYNYLALIFEDDDSYIGKNLIMDTSKSKHVVTRRASEKDESMLKKHEVTELPSLVLVKLGEGEMEHLSRDNRTYLGYVYSLQKVLDDIAKPPADLNKKIKTIAKPVVKVANVSSEIHMHDLIGAVSFSLRQEVPKKPVIKGVALSALKEWVNLLVQCFPAEKTMLTFLRQLEKWLQSNSANGKVHSSEYMQFFDQYQRSTAIFPQKIEWRGCKGSESKFRGFPCSLWTLFHTMTVDCGSKYSKNSLTGLDVLKRIRGFIDFFFGCRYCRDHFIEMAKKVDDEVSTHDEAIMWLWERHNRVNARLKNDISSDPSFPKEQFPLEDICETCRRVDKEEQTLVTDPGYGVPVVSWNKIILLDFLKDHYGPDNILLKNKEDLDTFEIDTKRPKFSYKFYPKSRTPATLSFIGLTRIDMSLCVVLYIGVIGTLIALYLYFIKRRKRKQWKNIV